MSKNSSSTSHYQLRLLPSVLASRLPWPSSNYTTKPSKKMDVSITYWTYYCKYLYLSICKIFTFCIIETAKKTKRNGKRFSRHCSLCACLYISQLYHSYHWWPTKEKAKNRLDKCSKTTQWRNHYLQEWYSVSTTRNTVSTRISYEKVKFSYRRLILKLIILHTIGFFNLKTIIYKHHHQQMLQEEHLYHLL
jgi:hypothetical protein